jgi:hypothetical protein
MDRIKNLDKDAIDLQKYINHHSLRLTEYQQKIVDRTLGLGL